MQHLWTAWQEIAEQIRGASHVLLLSDFDGTLSPIAARPELATMPADTARLLQDLAHRPGINVVVISGRGLSDIKARVGIPSITYAGNHGLEIEGLHVSFVHPMAEETIPVIRSVCRELNQALAHIEGVLVEDKGLTLTVHYRLVKKGRVGELRRLFEEVVNRMCAPGQVTVMHGKRVLEVRPAVDWGKGRAVDLLMNLCGCDGIFPIFMGDDVTDEEGFTLINSRGGISVFVGSPRTNTSAAYVVETPSQVMEFLGRLHAILVKQTPI